MHKSGDIMMVKFELLKLEQMLNIAKIAGNEIVHTDNMVTFLDKTVAQM